MKKSKPIAVIISDLHFNILNLELSTKALQKAIIEAKKLDVPLIIAGDLHDTKAIIRAEVANRLLQLLDGNVQTYIIVGNHDRINEKANAHGLNYLKDVAHIVEEPTDVDDMTLLPYYHDTDALKRDLAKIENDIVIMHQGVKGAFMGDYIQDKSSIDPEELANFTVISGHYHKHQTVGTVTYIGSPFTMTFGEANDGLKGFLVLNSDGSFERRILDLRKHVIINTTVEERVKVKLQSNDLLWLKITGPTSELKKLKKTELGQFYIGHSNFKLDLIPTDAEEVKLSPVTMSEPEMLDSLINGLDEPNSFKQTLKELWREIIAG